MCNHFSENDLRALRPRRLNKVVFLLYSSSYFLEELQDPLGGNVEKGCTRRRFRGDRVYSREGALIIVAKEMDEGTAKKGCQGSERQRE